MSIKNIFSQFKNPSNEYRGKPFWAWNGELDKEEMLRQGRVLGEMGFGGYFMHSRCGLITEYLGDEWFDITCAVADDSEKTGLEAWLYDEDRWPSGSAGGKVTENPEYRMKSLYLFETSAKDFHFDEDIVFLFKATMGDNDISIDNYEKISPVDISSIVDKEKTKILSFKIIPDTPNSNYNGNTYVDTMNKKAIERFIEVTHEEYKKRCGDRMGKSIKGIFTDEPHRGKAMDNYREEKGVRSSAIFYTEDIFEEFQKRYGYDAREKLPEIFYRLKGERVSKVRIDFFDLGCNLLNERFAIPLNNWCIENGMVLTGHVLHEDMLTTQSVPNGSLMRFYQHMGNPGIDILGNGNRSYWAAKQCQSVCRQFGKKWMLSELYGCSGWEFTLRSHKTLGDWQTLFGVNVRCPHLSWYTMEGEGKRDYPASVSYQSPYYKDYNYVESYFARLGLMLSQGIPVCDVLVLNPIESVWATSHLRWANWITPITEETLDIERKYTDTFISLAGSRIDFDYGEEQIMAENAVIDKDVLRIKNGAYKTVVVSGALTVRKTTLYLLESLLKNGGRVIFVGDMPKYVDGLPSDQCEKLLETYDNAVKVDLVSLPAELKKNTACPISDSANGNVFAQIRKDNDRYISVWLNRNETSAEEFEITAKLDSGYRAELWTAESGDRELYPSIFENGELKLKLRLEPAQMVVLVFTKDKEQLPIHSTTPPLTTGELTDGEFQYILHEPNVAVLDYAQYKTEADEDFCPLGEILKIDRKVRDRVGIEHRGGEMLQPWFSKSKYTENYGKITVRYPFNVDEIPDGDVYLAAERPETIKYFCNGTALQYTSKADWWVDNAFIKMPIPKTALKLGENEITATVDFKRTTNLEAVYLLGDFGVSAKAGASTLISSPETLSLDNITSRSLPFYSGRVSIILNFEDYVSKVDTDSEKIFIKIPEFSGADVTVEYGDEKKVIAWEPYTAEITKAVKEKLPLKITLVNTRRNSFGPLHIVPTFLGAYGPEHFLTEGVNWSDDYSFIDAKIGKVQFLSRK